MKALLRIARPLSAVLAAIAVLITGVMIASPAAHASEQPIRIGLVTFLSGPAAGPFGVPARIAAEAIVESLNAGGAPAPYGSIGFSGVPIELVIVISSSWARRLLTAPSEWNTATSSLPLQVSSIVVSFLRVGIVSI